MLDGIFWDCVLSNCANPAKMTDYIFQIFEVTLIEQ